MADPVDRYVAALPAAQAELVEALRALVKASAPKASEVVKWAQPVFEQNGPFCFIKAHKAHVTFGFWRGMELASGKALLESSGSKMGHVKIRAPEDIRAAPLRKLVREAVALNERLGDPTRRA